MQILSASVFVDISKDGVEEISASLKDIEKDIKKAYWLSLADENVVFYELLFPNITLDDLKSVVEEIGQTIEVSQIDISFKTAKNCLYALQRIGFTAYEEVEYVDFNYKEKGVKISCMKKEEAYTLRLHIIDKSKDISSPHLFSLINRVFEVVSKGGD